MGWSDKNSMKKKLAEFEEGGVAAAVFLLVLAGLGFCCGIFDLSAPSCRPPNVLISYVSFSPLIGVLLFYYFFYQGL